MTTNEKLEVFRRVYCLGQNDIETVFGADNTRVLEKYHHYRKLDGTFGNYSFLMYLDLEHAQKLLDYIGFGSHGELFGKGEMICAPV